MDNSDQFNLINYQETLINFQPTLKFLNLIKKRFLKLEVINKKVVTKKKDKFA